MDNFVNDAYCQHVGRAREELLGENWLERLSKDNQKATLAHLASLTLENPTATIEREVIASDGTRQWEKWTNRALFDEQGELLGYQCVGRDITERVGAEQALRESEERFRTLSNATFEGILITEGGKIVDANRQAASMLGYQLDELIGMMVSEFVSPEERDFFIEKFSEGWEETYEDRFLRKDGSGVMLEVRPRVMLKKGSPLGVTAIRDITERQQAEKVLQEYREHLEEMVEERTSELSQTNEKLQGEIEERMAVEEALRRRTHDLGERVKELNCLYGIANLVEKPEISLEEIYQGTVDLIPPAWQYLEAACAQLTIKGKVFSTLNFRKTTWRQSSDVVTRGGKIGFLQVCYLEEKPVQDEGPFLEEESRLIRAITERLGRVIERFQAEAAEQEQRAFAEALADTAAALNSTLEINEVLDRILDNLGRVLPHDSATIMLVDEGGKTVRVARHKGKPENGAASKQLTSSYSIDDVPNFRRMVETQKSYIIADVVDDPDWIEIEGTQEWQKSYAGAPIISDDNVIGFFTLVSGKPGYFKEEHAARLEAFAHQAAIAIRNANLYKQAGELAAMQERQRLARDMHDAVSQTLFTANLLAETLVLQHKRDPAKTPQGLEKLNRLTRGALAEMRSLLLELRPDALVKSDLGDLIAQLADGVGGRARLDIKLKLEGEGTLPPEVQMAFFHIAQEILNNIVKHARASEVKISFNNQPEQVILRIQDNGCGFDIASIPQDRLGLRIIKERAEDIGAALKIESQPGRGTSVDLRWSEK